MKKLYLSKEDKRLTGLCGGLGETYNIDPTLIRLIFAGLVVSPIPIILIYLIAWIIVPKKKEENE